MKFLSFLTGQYKKGGKKRSVKFDSCGIEPNDLNLWKAEIPASEENIKILKDPEIECIIKFSALRRWDQV